LEVVCSWRWCVVGGGCCGWLGRVVEEEMWFVGWMLELMLQDGGRNEYKGFASFSVRVESWKRLLDPDDPFLDFTRGRTKICSRMR